MILLQKSMKAVGLRILLASWYTDRLNRFTGLQVDDILPKITAKFEEIIPMR